MASPSYAASAHHPTTAMQDFSPYIDAFSSQFFSQLNSRSYKPLIIWSLINVKASPYHLSGDASFSCYKTTTNKISLRNPEMTASVINMIFNEFCGMLQEEKENWEEGTLQYGPVKEIELDVTVRVISSSIPLTEDDFHEICGLSPEAKTLLSHLRTLGPIMDNFIRGEISGEIVCTQLLSLFPGLIGKTEAEILAIIQNFVNAPADDFNAFEILRETLGIPSIPSPSDKDIFEKLAVDATGERVQDVFTITLKHSAH